MNKLKLSLTLLIAFLCLSHSVNGQAEELQVYSFEEVDSLNAIEAKKVFVFFHTDWCKFCHLMNQTTFKDEQVLKLLNNHFYFVSFDPESEATVKFAGMDFKFIPKGNKSGIHEIATKLGTVNGKVNYPSTCILNEDYEIAFQYDQYLSAEELLKVLNGILESE